VVAESPKSAASPAVPGGPPELHPGALGTSLSGPGEAPASTGAPPRRGIELPPPPKAIPVATLQDEFRGGPPPAEDPDDAYEDDEPEPLFGRDRLLGYLVSFSVHAVAMIVLACTLQIRPVPSPPPTLLAVSNEPGEIQTLGADSRIDIRRPAPGQGDAASQSDPASAAYAATSSGLPPLEPPSPRQQIDVAAVGALPAAPATEFAAGTNWTLGLRGPQAAVLDARGRGSRLGLASARGGGPDTEKAVARGLRWLQAHQLPDGGWRLDLQGGACQGQCRNPGVVPTRTGATALALLPFLGAGSTHQGGEYQEVVSKGLYYLLQNAKVTPQGVDLRYKDADTMYAQGLSALALCEAYAMTDDVKLREVAQRSLDFIVYAQDKQVGGWRYAPGDPGDTTVTAWQLMALKSGQMAHLSISTAVWSPIGRFLDSVQSENGALYGYRTKEVRPSTTAIGLLCRMYLGWRRTEPALVRGVGHLAKWGPSADDLYYDFYATQVMHHWEGPEWKEWNRKMRDHLLATQALDGHESGSWHFSGGRGGYGEKGGRLYNTALALMILEVYYRYMPLYQRAAVEATP